MTSRSIARHTDFTDFVVLDAMIAAALKRLLDKHIHFRKRVIVEEQRAQKHDRLLRGRQIACMIHEQFRTTGAYEAVQCLSNLFNLRLQNDDSRWDKALLAASEIPTEMVFGGFVQVEIEGFCSASDCWLCMKKRSFETTKQPSYSRLKASVRRHIDQTMMTRNFRARNEIVERKAVTMNLREKASRG